MLARFIIVIIGYVCGLLQTGYLISNFVLHKDLRREGSGNSGATNATRVFGPKIGALVLLGDVMKALVYCLIIRYAFAGYWGDTADAMMLYAAVGVVLGHCYPFYMNFKGGKGVASTAGLILAYDLRISAICLLLFIVIVAVTRYVSLGSLSVLTVFALCVLIFHLTGIHAVGDFPECMALSAFLAAHSFFTHRANIVRLVKGEENKFSFGKKEK